MTCRTCDGDGWVTVPLVRCVWHGQLVTYRDRDGCDTGRVYTGSVICDDCPKGRAEQSIEDTRASQSRAKGTPRHGEAGQRMGCAVRQHPGAHQSALGGSVTLSRILDAERARQGLTVYRMGLTAGIGQSALTRILDGTVASPEFGTVVKLLAALGKSLTWLDRQMKSESHVDVLDPAS